MRYKPVERRTLSGLADALGSGLDPSTGLQLYQQTQDSALQRLAAQQAARQQAMQSVQQTILGLAQQDPSRAAAESIVHSASSMYPNLGPQAPSRLQDLVQNLYQGGQSTLYQDPNAPAGPASTLDPQDRLAISTDLQSMINGAAGNPVANNVINARQKYQSLFGDSLTPEGQQALDQFVTDTWYAMGGPGPGSAGQDLGATYPGRFPSLVPQASAPAPTPASSYAPPASYHSPFGVTNPYAAR